MLYSCETQYRAEMHKLLVVGVVAFVIHIRSETMCGLILDRPCVGSIDEMLCFFFIRLIQNV